MGFEIRGGRTIEPGRDIRSTNEDIGQIARETNDAENEVPPANHNTSLGDIADAKMAFSVFDADNDGKLSRSELQALYQRSDVQAVLDQQDYDGDGALSLEEFLAPPRPKEVNIDGVAYEMTKTFTAGGSDTRHFEPKKDPNGIYSTLTFEQVSGDHVVGHDDANRNFKITANQDGGLYATISDTGGLNISKGDLGSLLYAVDQALTKEPGNKALQNFRTTVVNAAFPDPSKLPA